MVQPSKLIKRYFTWNIFFIAFNKYSVWKLAERIENMQQWVSVLLNDAVVIILFLVRIIMNHIHFVFFVFLHCTHNTDPDPEIAMSYRHHSRGHPSPNQYRIQFGCKMKSTKTSIIKLQRSFHVALLKLFTKKKKKTKNWRFQIYCAAILTDSRV